MAAAGAAARCTQRATEGYPVVVGEEEHVPTRRRQVGFPGDLYLHHAPGLGDDRHVHQTLTGVERVRRGSRSDQADPQYVAGIGRGDGDGLFIAPLGGLCRWWGAGRGRGRAGNRPPSAVPRSGSAAPS